MRARLLALLSSSFIVWGGACATAQTFTREEFRIPVKGAGEMGLESLLIRPNEPGHYPLALLSHGSPRQAAERPLMTPMSLLPQALEFARRGWAALIVMRRGYGHSGGGWAESYGSCANPDYRLAGLASASDLLAALTYSARLPYIDSNRAIAVGVSAGGFATIALSAEQPNGLIAAINFAGGRGSSSPDEVCRPERLIDAFAAYGARSRIPTLWIYAANDHFFGPAIARKAKEAFAGAGGHAELTLAPAFGADGHLLFSPAGIPVWTQYVDRFLDVQRLRLRSQPMDAPRSSLVAPEGLSPASRSAFAEYIIAAPHKAFAVSPTGAYGSRTARRTTEEATAGALENCNRYSRVSCRIIAVDDRTAQ